MISLENVSLDVPVIRKRFLSLSKPRYIRLLNDINIEINPGDSLCLIGKNGSGKTTLLQTISGIYEPTSGVVRVSGNIVSLTNLNLGIDRSLTGRENVVLRMLYLGHNKSQANWTVDEIEEFCELDSYFDAPVKTYSSGMSARLAFAISTAISSDIIVLDEWIGVGDELFKEKANQRLKEFIKKSGIVVFSSHSNSVIREWANRVVWLNNGEVKENAGTDHALRMYLNWVHSQKQ